MNINNNKYKLNVFNYTIYSNNIFTLLLAMLNAIYKDMIKQFKK